jgi:hypothetical protein
MPGHPSDEEHLARKLPIEAEDRRDQMKKIIGILIAIAVVVVIGFALSELRENGVFSSLAAPSERPAPVQTAGHAETYTFDNDKTGEMPAGFHGARKRGQMGGNGGLDGPF